MQVGSKTMAKQAQPLVLVGFGKIELIDALKLIGTDREQELLEMPIKNIPRHRYPKSCTPEQLNAFVQYVNWLSMVFDIDLEATK